VHNKSSKKNQNAHPEINPETIVSTPSQAKIHRASQSALRRIKEPIFRAWKELVKSLEFAMARHAV
jgi:hypothetical protein